MAQMTPLGFLGEAVDQALMILFLASPGGPLGQRQHLAGQRRSEPALVVRRGGNDWRSRRPMAHQS